jgi:hypothetical protein
VYVRFSVFAGLHPELGANGRVQFTVLGDGRELASATISGSEPCRSLECDLKGVSEVQLSLQSKGGDPKSNYAIWADPILHKF